jgi:hypothetical protein
MKAPILAVLMSLVTSNAFAADAGCKGNPALTGRCYMVRGDVFMSGDMGPVLGPDGASHERLGIRPAPNGESDMPDSIENPLLNDLHAEIQGVFEVCPIPAVPNQFPRGYTKFICINSASGLSVITSAEQHKKSN